MLRNLLTYIIAGLLLFLSISPVCVAKTINLYDQPQANAKIIGTIDPAKGIVPIFTPKKSEWVKVGDPSNANVGWIKSSDLTTMGTGTSGFSFTQRIVDDGKGPKSYIVQFGIPKPLTTEQSDALFKRIQSQQAILQKDVERMMQNFYSNFDTQWMNYPVIMPVVVMPPPTTPSNTATPPQKK